jgi:hypothetical protein
LFTNPKYSKATYIGLFMPFGAQFSGVSAVLFFSNTLFIEMKVLDPIWITTFLNLFNFLGTAIVAKLL